MLKKTDPSPQEIAEAAAALRENWSEAELLARSMGIEPSDRRAFRKGWAFRWRPPVCKTPRML